jgi:quercetin dioxygenase-like cupin family protein
VSYFGEATEKPQAPGVMVSVDTDLPEIELAPGIRSRPLAGANLLASFVRYEPNSVAPAHAHIEEQVFYVVEGELEMTLGGEVRRMRAGDAALIPAWVEHTVRSLDGPAFQIDVFSPPRAAMLELIAALRS